MQVVCCTCTAAASPSLGRVHRMVIIDEASQATEAATLIPLVKGAECVVLAGDPQQLPPTVLTQEARRLGLDRCAHFFSPCGDTCSHPMHVPDDTAGLHVTAWSKW